MEADAIAAEGINPDVFLLLNVPDEVLIERVAGVISSSNRTIAQYPIVQSHARVFALDFL